MGIVVYGVKQTVKKIKRNSYKSCRILPTTRKSYKYSQILTTTRKSYKSYRILPTTSSLTSLHLRSLVLSCTNVTLILR